MYNTNYITLHRMQRGGYTVRNISVRKIFLVGGGRGKGRLSACHPASKFRKDEEEFSNVQKGEAHTTAELEDSQPCALAFSKCEEEVLACLTKMYIRSK